LYATVNRLNKDRLYQNNVEYPETRCLGLPRLGLIKGKKHKNSAEASEMIHLA